MMFLLIFFLLHCVYVQVIVILADFALQEDWVDANPFSIIRSTEG